MSEKMKLDCMNIRELEQYYGYYLESSMIMDSFGRWCRIRGYIKTIREVMLCDLFQKTENAYKICKSHTLMD